MKIIFLILLVVSCRAQAGWVIAGDSMDSGVLKVEFKIADLGVTKVKLLGKIAISHCNYIKILEADNSQRCKLIKVINYKDSFFKEFKANSQFAATVLTQAVPVVAGSVLTASGLLAFEASLLLVSSGVALGAGSQALLSHLGAAGDMPELRFLNIVRMYDYSNIFDSDFIDDDTEVISLPDDSLLEIIESL